MCDQCQCQYFYQQYKFCICIETQVSCKGFYLQYASNWMVRFYKEMLQYFQYTIHSKYYALVEETSTGHYHNNYVESVVRTKYFILKFSISGSLISEKEFLNLYTLILVSFPLGGCVDEAAHSRTNYQGYKYVYLLQCHTLTVISFMDGGGVC